jgi:uncharacterized membrane protein YeaQ/YmgE (transglycosylase-associated protein family)
MGTGWLIGFIAAGVVSGLIACRLMRSGGLGLAGNISIGVIGALIGGALALLHFPRPAGGAAAVVMAVVGAAVLLTVFDAIKGA